MNDGNRSRRNSLVRQGSILAIAAFISRIIGFIYRIPLANMMTDVGNGYYGNASNIYAMFLMISTFGFPLAISKLMSERLQLKKYREAQHLFHAAMILAILLGLTSSVGLWFLAKPISIAMGSEKNMFAIRALSPALLIFAVLATLRGYFQGMNNMVPTAISQVIEQIFNAGFSMILAILLMKKGIEYAATGGTLGTGIGALFSLFLMLFTYYATSQVVIKRRLFRDHHGVENHTLVHYWGKILALSIPMIIGTAIISFTGVLDSLMVQRALILKGFTKLDAVALNGVYMMKHQPLITLPVAIASSFAAACVPSLAAASVSKDPSESKTKIMSALKITLIITIPAAVGFFVLGKPIIRLLFTSGDPVLAGKLLQVGAISIIFFSISSVAIGILQGLGKLKLTVYTSLIALLAKVGVNLFLILVLNMNIYGAVLANVAFSVVLAFLNLRAVRKEVAFQPDIRKMILIPSFAAIIMGMITYIFYTVLFLMSGSNLISTLLAIIVGCVVYLYVILQLKGMNEEELSELPGGIRLVRLLRRFSLI